MLLIESFRWGQFTVKVEFKEDNKIYQYHFKMNKITNQRSKLFAFVCMYISNQNEVEKRTKERINSDNKKKRIRTTTITTSSTSTIFFIAYILIQRSRENESERRVSSVIHSNLILLRALKWFSQTLRSCTNTNIRERWYWVWENNFSKHQLFYCARVLSLVDIQLMSLLHVV